MHAVGEEEDSQKAVPTVLFLVANFLLLLLHIRMVGPTICQKGKMGLATVIQHCRGRGSSCDTKQDSTYIDDEVVDFATPPCENVWFNGAQSQN